MDLVDIEDRFRDIISLNLKMNVVLIIFSLPKLFIGYDVCIETGDIDDIL